MNIPFSKVSMAGNEINYIKEVLDSGWLTTSSKAKELEDKFSKYVGAKYACALNSCTSALHLAVEALRIRPGDKVLVPTLTFTSTAEVLRYIGVDPIFIDVEYENGLVSPFILERNIEKFKNVKALMLVHYGGQAAEMITPDNKGILDLCRKHDIKLIEDAAHAFPTRFNNRMIGSFGDITCYSFYANKTITTAEGGMLVTDDVSIYNRVKIMRLHGIGKDVWSRYTSTNSSWEYDVVAPGYKYNMPDINAAIGLAQLEKAEIFRMKRQRCAEYYIRDLTGLCHIDLPHFSGQIEDHSWHLFPIIIKPSAPINRNEFIQRMGKFGIGTSVHYKPLHRMSYYKKRYYLSESSFPNAEMIWRGTVSLPIYPDLNLSELKYICQSIKSCLQN